MMKNTENQETSGLNAGRFLTGLDKRYSAREIKKKIPSDEYAA